MTAQKKTRAPLVCPFCGSRVIPDHADTCEGSCSGCGDFVTVELVLVGIDNEEDRKAIVDFYGRPARP